MDIWTLKTLHLLAVESFLETAEAQSLCLDNTQDRASFLDRFADYLDELHLEPIYEQ